MKQKLLDNWVVIVFTMLVTITGSVTVQYFQNKNNSIDNAAPKSYVDKKHEEQQKQIDLKADKHEMIEVKETLKTIDERIYDIWKIEHGKK